MISYSVIIPHKNIPDLLLRCLDSIPEREDLEIIVVDDNSNNETCAKLNEIQRQNTKIIYTKEGRGAGYARNVGLEHAKGQWIVFADADDILMPQFKSITNHLRKSNADVVYFDVCSKDCESLDENDEAREFNNAIEGGVANIKYQIEVPWGKAYQRNFVLKHNLCFEEVPCSNDTRFAVLGDYYATNLEIVNEIGYCWMTRKNSLWHTQTVKSFNTRMKVMLRLYRFMKSHNEPKLAEIYYSKAYSFLTKVKELSKMEFPYSMLIFGLYTKSVRMIFIDFPTTFIYTRLHN